MLEKKAKSDLRYKKTEILIQKAFYEMLQEMDYPQISIKKLTERAEINRKTFYLHYTSLDDLAAALHQELVRPFFLTIKNTKFPDDLEYFITNCFSFIASLNNLELKLFYVFINDQIHEIIYYKKLKRLCIDFYKHFFECFSDDSLKWSVISAYFNRSILEIFQQWNFDGRKVPLEEIVHLAIKLLSHGLLSAHLLPSAIPPEKGA